ncbi:hypothetical protein [Caballeronia humi]|uniref:Uncharacterized protein n=1 Tax=Caballeronia humi TaxID=326474 RepID=A0A158IUF0_9BURK|nr:hypothetical protein [Caballeronia humi]SAL60196.1 hypothetical protein AWB65_05424 [Caballeronia humi]
MREPDLKAKIDAIQVTTKAAQLRQLMPAIEAKLAEGVRAAQIVEILKQGGLELTIGTFRNYLHQYRIKQGSTETGKTSLAGSRSAAGPPQPGPSGPSGPSVPSVPSTLSGRSPLSSRPGVATEPTPEPGASESNESANSGSPSREPISMQELHRLMHPDPAKQAEEMAYYERLARQNRRSRKP